MQPVNLTPEQYKTIIALIKKTHCDFTHCERVLNEVNWDEPKANEQLIKEKKDFAEGKIRFNEKKEVVPITM